MGGTTTVVVYDLDSLKEYHRRLLILKEEVRTRGQQLRTLAEKLSGKASSMANITTAQGSNWQDPQYIILKDAISPCVHALKANAAMMSETTATIESTLAQVDASLAYLQMQISKIENV